MITAILVLATFECVYLLAVVEASDGVSSLAGLIASAEATICDVPTETIDPETGEVT